MHTIPIPSSIALLDSDAPVQSLLWLTSACALGLFAVLGTLQQCFRILALLRVGLPGW